MTFGPIKKKMFNIMLFLLINKKFALLWGLYLKFFTNLWFYIKQFKKNDFIKSILWKYMNRVGNYMT